MAHAKINLDRLFDWLGRVIDMGEPLPDDAAICERFGFTSTESARTLLAELADAGRITIRGHGEGRVITLGRARLAFVPACRPTPAVKKTDPDVERGAERLIAIARRGRADSAPTQTPPPTPPPPISIAEEAPMAATKSVTFVAAGSVLDEIKRRTSDGTSNNKAALDLIEAGMRASQAPIAAEAPPQADASSSWSPIVRLLIEHGGSVDDLVADLVARATAGAGRDAEVAELTARADAAEGRADAAEGKLQLFREALAA